jgi:hypothetical protein
MKPEAGSQTPYSDFRQGHSVLDEKGGFQVSD